MEKTTCKTCSGQGEVVSEDLTKLLVCPECNGDGILNGPDKCRKGIHHPSGDTQYSECKNCGKLLR